MQADKDGNIIGDTEGEQVTSEDAEAFWEVGTSISQALGLKSRQPHILINGRVCHQLQVVNIEAS